MSNLIKTTIKTSPNHMQNIIITTQQIKNSHYGNPQHKIQVWIDRPETTGNLWTPIVEGYKRLKDDSYTIESFNINMDIHHFIKSFEKAIQ